MFILLYQLYVYFVISVIGIDFATLRLDEIYKLCFFERLTFKCKVSGNEIGLTALRLSNWRRGCTLNELRREVLLSRKRM